MQEVMTQILRDLKDGLKGQKIQNARFEVGELAEVSIEELESFLQQNADFEFELEEKKARVKCKCGFVGVPEVMDRSNGEAIAVCKCGEVPEIIDGKGIKIIEVKIKE